MRRVQESIVVHAAPTAVWAYVADPLNDPEWCPKVKSVRALGDGRWEVTHKPVPMRAPMRLQLEHIVLDAPRRLTMREEDEASTFAIEYQLVAVPMGTRFTQTSEFEWKTLPRVLHSTFERGVRRDVRRQLQRLKATLERR